MNLASDADDYSAGKKPGWISTAWDGLQQTVELANERRIKIIINGGALDPKALAVKTHALVRVSAPSVYPRRPNV